jgi:diaminopimelate decarboxylase
MATSGPGGIISQELNIGGGHGIPYVTGDPELDLATRRC